MGKDVIGHIALSYLPAKTAAQETKVCELYTGSNISALGNTCRIVSIYMRKKQSKLPAWMETSEAEKRKGPNKGKESK